MSQFLMLDPVARDYVFQNGSPIETDRVLERAYMALAIPENKWLYGAPGQGSFLYTLANIKRTGSVEQNFASFVENALQAQLVDLGYASQDAVQNIEATRTGTSNQIEIIPTTTPVQSTLSFVSV